MEIFISLSSTKSWKSLKKGDIIDHEHGYKLDDKALVDAIMAEHDLTPVEWKRVDAGKRRDLQLDLVEYPDFPGIKGDPIYKDRKDIVKGDVIDLEHGFKIGNKDLIKAICDAEDMTVAEFKRLPAKEQIEYQLDWVEYPM